MEVLASRQVPLNEPSERRVGVLNDVDACTTMVTKAATDASEEKMVEAASSTTKYSQTESDLPRRTQRQIYLSHLQFSAVCLSLFMQGWNDGSTGPLLPRIRQSYNLNYVMVSLIFILSCVVSPWNQQNVDEPL